MVMVHESGSPMTIMYITSRFLSLEDFVEGCELGILPLDCFEDSWRRMRSSWLALEIT